MGHHLVVYAPRRDFARPAHQGRHPVTPFPVGVFLTAKRRYRRIRPHVEVWPVVGGVKHDGIVSQAQLVDPVQQGTHLVIVLQHGIVIETLARASQLGGIHMGVVVHAGGVEPDKKGLLPGRGLVDELEGRRQEFGIHCLHALARQRAAVLDLAVGEAADHPAGAKLLPECGALRVVRILRLLLGVEVVEVAEKLVEAVVGRQELVPVTQVVLAELPGGVTQGFEQFRQGRILGLQAEVRARDADFGQPGADRALPGDEGRAPRRTALLAVVVGKQHALAGDPVDIGRLVTHQPVAVLADIPDTDVVAPDDENIGAFGCHRHLYGQAVQQRYLHNTVQHHNGDFLWIFCRNGG